MKTGDTVNTPNGQGILQAATFVDTQPGVGVEPDAWLVWHPRRKDAPEINKDLCAAVFSKHGVGGWLVAYYSHEVTK